MEVIKKMYQEIAHMNEGFKADLDNYGVDYKEIKDVKVYEAVEGYNFYEYMRKRGQRVLLCVSNASSGDVAAEDALLISIDKYEEYDLKDVIQLIRDYDKVSDSFLFAKVYTFPEASEKWGLADGTLRNIPRSPGRLIEGIDYRKSGKVWLITEAAMRKLYGEPKK